MIIWWVFGDQKALDTYHNFFGYIPDRPESLVGTTVSSRARLDAIIFTVTSLISRRDQRDGG